MKKRVFSLLLAALVGLSSIASLSATLDKVSANTEAVAEDELPGGMGVAASKKRHNAIQSLFKKYGWDVSGLTFRCSSWPLLFDESITQYQTLSKKVGLNGKGQTDAGFMVTKAYTNAKTKMPYSVTFVVFFEGDTLAEVSSSNKIVGAFIAPAMGISNLGDKFDPYYSQAQFPDDMLAISTKPSAVKKDIEAKTKCVRDFGEKYGWDFSDTSFRWASEFYPNYGYGNPESLQMEDTLQKKYISLSKQVGLKGSTTRNMYMAMQTFQSSKGTEYEVSFYIVIDKDKQNRYQVTGAFLAAQPLPDSGLAREWESAEQMYSFGILQKALDGKMDKLAK